MSDLLSYGPPAIGVLLIVIAVVLFARRPAEGSMLTVMLISGVALLLLSDQGILNFKLGTTGVELSRKDLQAAKEAAAVDFAKIKRDLSDHAKILEEQAKTLKKYQDILENLTQRAGDASAATALKTTNVTPTLDRQNSKYVVLVFYREGKRSAANKIVEALLKEGYQSSATNTDLKEIVPQIAGDRHPGRIVIAAASTQLPALSGIASIVKRVATENGLEAPEVDDENWTFRRGDVQIYLF